MCVMMARGPPALARRNLTLVGQMAHAPCWPLARMHCGLGMCRSMHAIDHRTKMPCMSALWGSNEHSQGVPDEALKNANSAQRTTRFSMCMVTCLRQPPNHPAALQWRPSGSPKCWGCASRRLPGVCVHAQGTFHWHWAALGTTHGLVTGLKRG